MSILPLPAAPKSDAGAGVPTAAVAGVAGPALAGPAMVDMVGIDMPGGSLPSALAGDAVLHRQGGETRMMRFRTVVAA